MSIFSVKIIIQSVLTEEKEHTITIDNDYTLYDLSLYLFNLNGIPYIYSSFRIRQTYTMIDISNLEEKLVDHINNNEITLLEVGYFSPKNSFHQLQNIINLHKHHLLGTTNINDECPINLVKIGEYSGNNIDDIIDVEDNRIHNLIFIRYNNDTPTAYNIHCLEQMIFWDNISILIPHLNKKIRANKFVDVYENRNHIKILELNGNDIIYV